MKGAVFIAGAFALAVGASACDRQHNIGRYGGGAAGAGGAVGHVGGAAGTDASVDASFDADARGDVTETAEAHPDALADEPQESPVEVVVEAPPDARPAGAADAAETLAPFAVVPCGAACARGGGTCVGELCQDGVSRWPTVGGDIHHSGWNRGETGHPPLTKKWRSIARGGSLAPAISDGGLVYLASNGFDADTTFLAALSPDDGTFVWNHPFVGASVGQPTIDRDRVYLGHCSSDTKAMYAFAAASGDVLWQRPLECQNESYWAPLVVGDGVYMNAGGYGGLVAFSTKGDARFVLTTLPQLDRWSPMFLGGNLYTYLNGYLKSFDAVSGSPTFSAGVAADAVGSGQFPVTDGERIYVVSPPELIAYRPKSLNPAWTITGAYAGAAAVADGVVYVVSGGQLRAHDALTGDVLWTAPGDSHLTFTPIVVGHTVYVSSADTAFAYDTLTQERVWRVQPGGALAVANGSVYVSQSDGWLVAYGLTR